MLSKRSPAFAKHFFNVNKYNRYGLYHDDLIGAAHDDVNPEVTEAYRRLSIDQPHQHDLRVFRSLRANQLYIQKKILPEDQWTTFEEDQTKGRYLQKYLQQIKAEQAEKVHFAKLDAE